MIGSLSPLPDQLSLQERTYQAVRGALLKGDYMPGDRIYEGAIAQALGVSRNPVREALRRLQQDGLLEVRPHYGVYVATIPVEEIEDIYRIRGALEATAAALAAERMSDADVAELREIVAEQQAAAASAEPLPREPVSVVQADRFHHAIHIGARSPRLLTLLEQIYAQVTHFRNLTLRVPGRASVSAVGHSAIFDAIRTHQMRLHIEDARQALMHQLSNGRSVGHPDTEGE
jgi:DNA-binding GntR family transcriptional regulator